MDTKKLRQKILDLAIHGKLVPQDLNDEPASVLLERIKAEKEQLIKEGKIKRQKKSASSDTSHYGNDVPFEVPEGWMWCRLGDIAYVAAGSTPSKECFVEHGIPYIKMYNLRNQKIDFDFHPQYIDYKTHTESLHRSMTQVGDIIMNIVGPPLGKLAIIPNNLPEANFNQAAVLIRPLLHKSILNKYIFRYLEQMSEINSISTKGSAGQVNISLTQSQNIRIPLPPLNEQKRITEEIDRRFALVDALEQNEFDLKDAVQKAKSKILDFALSGRLTSHTSHYGKNEETFSETTLGNVCKLCDGEKITGKDYTNLDVKYLRGTKSGDMLHSGRFVPAGSLMILVDGENSGEVFTTPIDGYQGSTFKILDIDAKYCKEFILLLIQSNRKSLRENKVGSAIPHLNKKMFKEIVVPPFSYSEQCEIAQTVKDYFCVLDSIVG